MLGTLVTTTLTELVVGIEGVEGLTTVALEDKGIDGVKFKDTTGALGMLDSGTLTCRGDTLLADMAELWV